MPAFWSSAENLTWQAQCNDFGWYDFSKYETLKIEEAWSNEEEELVLPD